MSIILASASPRRRELLSKIYNGEIIVDPTNIDEGKITSRNIEEYPLKTSLAKLHAAISIHENETILAADTIVLLDDKILGKPHDYNQAFKMLMSLQDNTHDVITGYSLYHNKKIYSNMSYSKVEFFPMSEEEIDEYINTSSPFDKAGGYGIQDLKIKAEVISGSFYNVMGLPIEDIKELFDTLHISL